MRTEGLGIGIFFLVAGVLFLLDAIEVLDLRPEFLLPLLLIGFGIALLASGRGEPAQEASREREAGPPEEPLAPPPPTPPPPEDHEEDDEEEDDEER